MRWFQKSKDKNKTRRRRKDSRSSTKASRERPDPGGRKPRSKRKPGQRSRRSASEESRGTRREDTRDRDDLRRKLSRDRIVSKEQQETFDAINFNDEIQEFDAIDRSLGRGLNILLYVLLVLLVIGAITYGVGWAMDIRAAARMVPLQSAAAEGDVGTLRVLIQRDLPVDGIGPSGGTPLSSAIRAGQLEAAQLLLENGAEPSAGAIQLTMRYENWDILKALISAGGDPDVRGQWTGRSALELAVEREDDELVGFLLAHGAEAGAISNEGPKAQPALHYAAANGMREYVELLLEHGADPRKLWMGFSARMLAEAADHDEVADILIRAEAALSDPA